jgi:hypothetical protein
LASVRWIVGIILLLFVVGWLACQLEVSATNTVIQVVPTLWRHTARGWERMTPSPAPPTQSSNEFWAIHPHPLILTLLEGMLSVLVLVAFSPANLSSSSAQQLAPHGSRQQNPLRKHLAKLGEIELRSRSWWNNPDNS